MLVALAESLCHRLRDPRAARLLMNISAGLPIVPVPAFLEALGGGGDPARDGSNGGAAPAAAKLATITPTALSSREKVMDWRALTRAGR